MQALGVGARCSQRRVAQLLRRNARRVGRDRLAETGGWRADAAVVEAASKLHPDVCLIDISMPILNGIEIAKRLRESGSSAKVIFLTIHEDPDFLRAALDSGARGYVVKRCLSSDLPTAVKEVLAGRTFISSSLCHNNGGCLS